LTQAQHTQPHDSALNDNGKITNKGAIKKKNTHPQTKR
jgi:hypothetical protein